MALFNDRRTGLTQVNEGGVYPEGTQVKAKGLVGWRSLSSGRVSGGKVDVGPTMLRNGTQVSTTSITKTRQGKPYKPPRYIKDTSPLDIFGP